MPKNKEIGNLGEGIACKYLVKNKWIILFRNYRRKCDEIDIIARSKSGILGFFEVKTLIRHGLSTLDALRPEDNLTPMKLRKITRACEFFSRKHPELVDPDAGWRMDLIAIDLSPDQKLLGIRHYENI